MIAQTIKLEAASTIQISHVLLASLKYPISSTFLGFSISYGAGDISEFVEFVKGSIALKTCVVAIKHLQQQTPPDMYFDVLSKTQKSLSHPTFIQALSGKLIPLTWICKNYV